MRRALAAASVTVALAVSSVALVSCGSPMGPDGAASSNPRPSGAAVVTPETGGSTGDPLPDPRLEQVGDAGQAVVVTAGGYGVNSATLTAYEREGGRWRLVMGPWSAHIGNKGFAPPGQKAEGDGRTPSGTYGFSFFFGVAPDPGVRFEYRQVPDASIVWDEDPASPTYNLWIDLDDFGGGTDPEGMYQPVAYRHGAVIAYNTARTPGLGSGIFLHASTGRATAGCVSLPVEQLVAVLRWLDPARTPRIVLGVAG